MYGRATGRPKTAKNLACTERGKGAGVKVRSSELGGVDLAGSWKSVPAFTLWM